MTLLLAALLSVSSGFQAAPRTQYAVSTDGTRIAYDVTGSGPVVILLHGGGSTRRSWHEAGYVSRLAAEFTVVTMDIRGNGESGRPPLAAAFAPARLNQDVLAVANAVKAERFVIWGFSYGANVGRYLAAVSDRVRGMVYVGIPFGAAADGMFRERILGMANRPAWLAALLDYPPVEPSHMRSPTLWLVGTANESAYASARSYQPKLAGTKVSLATIDGLTHSQEFERIDQVFSKEVEFIRALPR
ncbi:MAG: alpha/beta fold hydrolase [Vicinamibacterales bacterium]